MVWGRSAGSVTSRKEAALLPEDRQGQKRREGLLHRDRAGARAAAAVRGGEGLVEVVLHDIEAHVAGPGHAEQRVHVGAVAVDQSPLRVDDRGDLGHVALEQPQGVRVRDHDGGDVLVHGRGHGLGVEAAVRAGGELDRPVAVERRGSRVGPVGGVGDEHLLARVAPRLVVGADHHEAAQLALGAGGRREGGGVHAGDLGQGPLKPMHQLERALAQARAG